jgi:hypothetical protein
MDSSSSQSALLESCPRRDSQLGSEAGQPSGHEGEGGCSSHSSTIVGLHEKCDGESAKIVASIVLIDFKLEWVLNM